jgi:hypothetical protein
MPQNAFASPSIYNNSPGPRAAEGLAILAANQASILELCGAQPEAVQEIIDGVITPTQAAIVVDTEGQAPEDDLTTLATTTIHAGAEVTLRAADASRAVTLIYGTSPGGLLLISGEDETLDPTIEKRFREKNGLWYEVSEALPLPTDVLATPGTVVLRDADGRAQISAPAAAEDIATMGYVDGARLVGNIQLLPFRATELPAGWYFCNGDQYALTSPQGMALNALSDNFKADWGLSVSGSNISLPNMFYTDGRGYFLRSVDGTTRQAGSVVNDQMRPITAGFQTNGFIRYSNGDYTTGAFVKNTTDFSSGSVASSGTPYNSGIKGIDSSLLGINFSGAETHPLERGMTPAIFLGV